MTAGDLSLAVRMPEAMWLQEAFLNAAACQRFSFRELQETLCLQETSPMQLPAGGLLNVVRLLEQLFFAGGLAECNSDAGERVCA